MVRSMKPCALALLLAGRAAVAGRGPYFPGPAPIPSAGCGKPLTVPVGSPLNMMIPVDDPMLFNKYREYYLFLPEGFLNTEPLPMTVSFHGFYDEAIDLEKTDKLMAKSAQMGKAGEGGSFITVHPQGMMDTGTMTPQVPYPQRTWNCGGTVNSPGKFGPVCSTANRSATWGVYPCYQTCQLHGGCKDDCYSSTCANDVLFTKTLLDYLEDNFCVDRRRLHATGMSNGGMMAYQAGVSLSSRFASMVPVAGSALLGFWKPPDSPIALMDIHGTMDETIPANRTNGYQWPKYQGPHGSTFSDDGMYYTNNTEIIHSMAVANNCSMGKATHWPTSYDGKCDWYCWLPHGDCGRNPVVRCTWYGKHQLPCRGHKINHNVSHKEKVYAFANITFEWMQQRWLEDSDIVQR